MHRPLASQEPREVDLPALSLVERPLAGMINLRGSPDDPAFIALVAKIVGLPFPVHSNRFVARSDMQCIWQGPDEWLLAVPDGRHRALIGQLEDALDGLHHAVTDVTGNRSVLRLTGANAIPLLASGCPLDFDAMSFPAGTAAQTILARTPVTILRVDDAPGYDIHVRRSCRVWLRDWLLRAAASLVSG